MVDSRTIITQVFPEAEGIDSKHEVDLPYDFSWEVRFYHNVCGKEIAESDIESHVCEDDK
jgi:hypothetical protein